MSILVILLPSCPPARLLPACCPPALLPAYPAERLPGCAPACLPSCNEKHCFNNNCNENQYLDSKSCPFLSSSKPHSLLPACPPVCLRACPPARLPTYPHGRLPSFILRIRLFPSFWTNFVHENPQQEQKKTNIPLSRAKSEVRS